jgi:hypothetical protein
LLDSQKDVKNKFFLFKKQIYKGMRTKDQCRETAHQLLAGEFENFKHNPSDYCRSMGWHKDSKGTKKAIKKADDLCWTADDTNRLAAIIESKADDDMLEIVESNEVSDFLCSCIAGHIQA